MAASGAESTRIVRGVGTAELQRATAEGDRARACEHTVLPRLRTPPLSVVPPLYVLAPLSVSVPDPALLMLLVELGKLCMTPDTVSAETRVHAKASYGRRQAERRRNGITRACCENRVRHHKVLVASAARLGGRDRRIPVQIDNAQSMGIVAEASAESVPPELMVEKHGMGRVPNRVVGGCQAHLGSGARNRQAAAVGKRNDRTESQRARVGRRTPVYVLWWSG